MFLIISLCLSLLVCVAVIADPTVDLGYTIQQGIAAGNDGIPYYNFSNIRYAGAPTGPRRFEPPTVPPTNRTLQNISSSVACPQALPMWFSIGEAVVNGQQSFNLSGVPPFVPNNTGISNSSYSEDCLFLDVLVTKKIFDAGLPVVPVLVFIHGGGFTEGSKVSGGSGVGLLRQAANHGHDIIYVSINYRLGLFGWLAGTNETTPNLGLLDQQYALQWVRHYIHLFGGDPSSVTVMGESSGGGSIMYHLGSRGLANASEVISQAILQSPYVYNIPPQLQNVTYTSVLQMANVSSFAGLKQASYETLDRANQIVVGNSQPYGTFSFGPIVDGTIVTHCPAFGLANATANIANTTTATNTTATTTDSTTNTTSINPNIKIMAAHNTNEGLLFASPFIMTEQDYEGWLISLFPNITSAALSTIKNDLYPRNFNGSYGYTDQLGRVAATFSDAFITCNTFYLTTAYANRSFAYEFSVPPGAHTQDLNYTFFDPAHPLPGVNATLAMDLQTYITAFSALGSPNVPSLPPFPVNGDVNVNVNLNNVTAASVGVVASQNLTDSGIWPSPNGTDVNVARCLWWWEGSYQ